METAMAVLNGIVARCIRGAITTLHYLVSKYQSKNAHPR
jgi:hypothetical protein